MRAQKLHAGSEQPGWLSLWRERGDNPLLKYWAISDARETASSSAAAAASQIDSLDQNYVNDPARAEGILTGGQCIALRITLESEKDGVTERKAISGEIAALFRELEAISYEE